MLSYYEKINLAQACIMLAVFVFYAYFKYSLIVIFNGLITKDYTSYHL